MPGPGSAGEVYVDVLPWLQDFDRKLKAGVASSAARISRGFTSTGKTLSKFVTLPLLAAGVASVKLASDAAETENKVKVIFGKMAGEVLDWSDTSIESMGLARATAQDMAAELAAVFQASKLPGPAVADMSEKFVQLSADMASFFNVRAEDALTALRSGLVGEAEPLRRFGVLLSEAAVKTEAVRLGIAKTGQELTEQQKVQARASIIQKSLTKATGDYARTSDGVANKMRATTERAKELGARFGEQLIPIVQKLLDTGSKVLDWFDGLNEGQRQMIINLAAVFAAAGPVLFILGKMIGIVSKLTGVFIGAGKGIIGFARGMGTGTQALQNLAFTGGLATAAIGLISFAMMDNAQNAARNEAAINRWAQAMANGEITARELNDEINRADIPDWAKAQAHRMIGESTKRSRELADAMHGVNRQVRDARSQVRGLLDQLKQLDRPRNIAITFSKQGLPKFQHGGVFHAPRPGGEGLAVLHDRERILRRGESMLSGVGDGGGFSRTYQANVTGIMEPITAKEIQTIFRRMEFLAGEA